MSPMYLAQVIPIEGPKVSPALWDFLLVGGVITVLAIIIFVVAAVTRQRRPHRHRSRHGPEILKNTDEHIRDQTETNSPDDQDKDSHQRRRRKRRDHRPRNPTLAESGGLPPERDPNSVPHTGL